MTKRLSYLRKLDFIKANKTLYQINYRNAGVALVFYVPPVDYDLPCFNDNTASNDWKKYLVTSKYFPTIEKAIEYEYQLILGDNNE